MCFVETVQFLELTIKAEEPNVIKDLKQLIHTGIVQFKTKLIFAIKTKSSIIEHPKNPRYFHIDNNQNVSVVQ